MFDPTLSRIMQGTQYLNRPVWLAAIACAFLSLHKLSAQAADGSTITHAASCLDTLSTPASIPRIVYIRADVNEPTDSGIAEMADIFAQSVSLRMRSLLNARGDTLPPGEPDITWRKIERHTPLGVTVYRNAPPVFRLLSPHTDSIAAATLLAAAHKTTDEGEGPFWPEGTRADSLKFGISFELTLPGKRQLTHPPRIAFPVFSVFFPPEVPVRLTSKSQPEYPSAELREGITAVIILEFQVDSTGRAIPGSIKEVWSPTKKRPTGRMLDAYNDFLDSVTRWLSTAEFEPARIGGCRVRQFVGEPFTFSIASRASAW